MSMFDYPNIVKFLNTTGESVNQIKEKVDENTSAIEQVEEELKLVNKKIINYKDITNLTFTRESRPTSASMNKYYIGRTFTQLEIPSTSIIVSCCLKNRPYESMNGILTYYTEFSSNQLMLEIWMNESSGSNAVESLKNLIIRVFYIDTAA